MGKRESFVFYRSFLEAIEDLDIATQNEFFMAISKYALDGQHPQFTGLKQAVWKQIKYNLDISIARYEKCVDNGGKGGAPKGSKNNPKGRNQYSKDNQKDNQEDNQEDNLNVNDNSNDNPNVNDNANDKKEINLKRQTFKSPTLQEVKDYVLEKGYNMSAEMFFDYYTSNGWKVGRNSMKDWKAAVNNWNRKQSSFENSKLINVPESKQQRDAEFADHIAKKLTNNDEKGNNLW